MDSLSDKFARRVERYREVDPVWHQSLIRFQWLRSTTKIHPVGPSLRESIPQLLINAGQRVALHYREDSVVDPVKALRAWLNAAAISSGPVFRLARGVTVGADGLNSAAVSRVTKEAAERAGLNASGYSAHSLRAGFVSECDRRHIPNGAVRAVTRHASDAMLAVYDRPGELFSGSAGAYFEGV